MNEYPTDEQLDKIKNWPDTDLMGLMDYVTLEVWNCYCGRVKRNLREHSMELVTGGWSGNEEIIEALQSHLFWSLFWESSHRGGLYIFKGIKELGK